MDEKLTWTEHVNGIIKSLVKYFGIFNSIKHYISTQLAKQLYYAFIYPRLKYGIEVYGSCNKNLINKLQVVQNKMLKLLLNRTRRTNTDKLHYELKLMKFNDIYNYSLALFTYDSLYKECPLPLHNYFTFCTNNTRQAGQLLVRRTRTKLGDSTVRIKSARLWNSLDQCIRNQTNKNTMKRHLKSYFISKYQTQVR